MNLKTINNDDTRDIAIRIVEYLIDNKYITEFEDENEWDFHIQDVIHGEINETLEIDEESEMVMSRLLGKQSEIEIRIK